MTRKRFAVMAAALTMGAAMAMTSCMINEETIDGPDTGTVKGGAVRFTAGVAGSTSAAPAKTRTTNGGDTWVVGDGIGIYMLTAGGAIPTGIAGGAWNERYNVADATTGALSADASADAIEYPASGNVDFIAYYPYGETGGGNVSSDGKYTVPLADQSDMAKIDVMTAKVSNRAAATGGTVDLTFRHALSKLTINVRAGDNIETDKVTAIGDVKLSGGIANAAVVDLADGTVSGETFGGVKIQMHKAATAPEGYDASFTAIIAPMPHGGGGRHVTLVVDGKPVVWSVPNADAFEQGNHYTYSGTITGTSFGVVSSNITPWNSDNDRGEIGKAPAAKIQQNFRITWSNSKSEYAVTNNINQGAGLYFKFGSVVGVFSGHGQPQNILVQTSTDTYHATDVPWSPVAVTDNWMSIPAYEGADYPATVTPASGYHTIANVKAGKGDPCRLVGLDLAKIADTDADKLTQSDIDNGYWRLPTAEENAAFADRDANGPFTGHWTTQTSSEQGGVDRNLYGGMFPNAAEGDATTFLPAAGYRMHTGTVCTQGTTGLYWTSTPVSTELAIDLHFTNSWVYPYNENQPHNFAASVRCVRQ